MIKKVLLGSAAAVVLVYASLVAVEMVYAQQAMPGIKIDGMDIAGKNRASITTDLDARFASYNENGIILALNDKKSQVKLSDMGMSFDVPGAINQAFSFSHSKYPGYGTIKTAMAIITKKNNITPRIVTDATKKQSFLNDSVHATFGTRPQDASLKFSDADKTVQISDAAPGVWVIDESLVAAIESAMTTHTTNVIVPTEVKQASIQTKDLAGAKTEAEAILGRTITLVAPTKKVTPTWNDIAQWLTLKSSDDGLHASLDPDKVKIYLTNSVAPTVEQKVVNTTADPSGNVLSNGKNGVTLKVDDSVTLIIDALAKSDAKPQITLATSVKNQSTVTVDPQDGCAAGKMEGKYIEVNIKKQKMCLFDGSTFITTFRVSTGKWSTPTPVGTFTIANKASLAWSAEFALNMPDWNGLTGPGIGTGKYGIHGLPYNNTFHEDPNHIGEARSHGCIRLGPGNDDYVFSWAPVGTTVIIHT